MFDDFDLFLHFLVTRAEPTVDTFPAHNFDYSNSLHVSPEEPETWPLDPELHGMCDNI